MKPSNLSRAKWLRSQLLALRKAKKEQGQATIFVATLIATFLLFFMFVANTGLLVHAKINLQNAADLAAYSGAAVQARQLTHISYLNYEMRRQYKKFLFRYYVIGNMAQETHPTNGGGGTRKWAPKQFAAPPDNYEYGTPTTCIIYAANDNYCLAGGIAPLPVVGGGATDPVVTALGKSFDALDSTLKSTCKALGQTNIRALMMWLMNTDPTQERLQQEIQNLAIPNPADKAKVVQRMRALQTMTLGIGLIPKNIMLGMRIKTLGSVLNSAPQNVTLSSVNGLKRRAMGWFEHERTIQAYLSAYHTLGNNLFPNPDDIVLQELTPGGGSGPTPYVKLEPQQISADLFASNMGLRAGGVTYCLQNASGQPMTEGGAVFPGTNDPTTNPLLRGAGCAPCLVTFVFGKDADQAMIPFQIPVGYQKAPDILTYYAVKLSAKARLMFASPLTGGSNEIELEAVSAAQPFGSRIGPYVNPGISKDAPSIFTSRYGGTSNAVGSMCSLASTIGYRCQERAPNLPIKANETVASQTAGWNALDAQFNYFQGIGVPNPTGPGYILPTVLSATALERAYQVAMSPTPWELGNYNIPNDYEAGGTTVEPFLKHFDSTKGNYSIWAPLVLPSVSGQSAEDLIKAQINLVASQMNSPKVPTSMKTVVTEMAQLMEAGIGYYVTSKLTGGAGLNDQENNETVNIYRFRDPVHALAPGGPPTQKIGISPTLHEGDPKKLRTSWGKVLSGEVREAKRNTYSVKFVPFKLITEGGSGGTITTNGSTAFRNKLPASAVGGDLDKIEH